MVNTYLNFTGRQTIEIAREKVWASPVGAEELRGHTLYTLISAGTELNASFLDVFDWGYPKKSGYTAVFRVDEVGESVKGYKPGDVVFCMGAHQSCQSVHHTGAIKIPDNVAPEDALYIRMAGVSMATFSRTRVPTGEKLMVVGLGPVGHMAARIYSALGYEVIAVEHDEGRRKILSERLPVPVFNTVPRDNPKYYKRIALALDCTGNEAAVFDCCDMVRPHGEVSLVGVPWKRMSDLDAHRLTHSIFYNYVTLYGGWEMDLPRESSQFNPMSMNRNYRLALKLIADGTIDLSGLSRIRPYTEGQVAFEAIMNRAEPMLATVLSWQ